MNLNDKLELCAGGPGSGRHPGFGEKGGLLEKYGDFMQRHNPDMTDATQHYAHAAEYLNKLGESGKKVMHGFLDHMKNA